MFIHFWNIHSGRIPLIASKRWYIVSRGRLKSIVIGAPTSPAWSRSLQWQRVLSVLPSYSSSFIIACAPHIILFVWIRITKSIHSFVAKIFTEFKHTVKSRQRSAFFKYNSLAMRIQKPYRAHFQDVFKWSRRSTAYIGCRMGVPLPYPACSVRKLRMVFTYFGVW